MTTKSNSKELVKLITVSVLTVGVMSATTACGKRTGPGTATPSTTPSGAPAPDVPDVPDNNDSDNNGQTDLPQEPTDVPEPLPAPVTPVQPGQNIAIRAIAKTTSYILPVGNVKGNYVNIEVTWQPVTGAKEYWVYKNSLPKKEEATKGNAYKVVSASGISSTLFIDGVMPPSFVGGNFWDKVKKAFNAVTIRPGVEYKYKVIAADMDGNVLGESDAGITIPLPPIAAPANLKISETASQAPLFQWEETPGAAPDGFYVGVFPPIQFGKQPIQSKGGFGLAYWSTFRLEKTKLARYGSQSDNMAAYPGTLPFDVSFPLRNGNRYTVSVTSVKTDSNDMRTAKAISKAWSESKLFTIGVEQPDPNTPAPAPTQAPSQGSGSTSKVGGVINKIKGIFGF